MIADLVLAPAPAAATVFEVYRSRWCTVRMAQLTADTAGLIAAESNVWLRSTRRGWEVFTIDGWKPASSGDYVVHYGHAPDKTAVVTAGYVDANYSRELAGLPE